MLLKESFSYQNKLTELIQKIAGYLSFPENVITKTQTHYKSTACADAADETKILEKQSQYHRIDFEVDNNTLLALLDALFVEKCKLGNAISQAKKSCEVDIDCVAAENKVRHSLIEALTRMSCLKSCETESTSTAFTFNAIDGKQMSYIYPVKTVATIDFDRNVVKKKVKALKTQADAVSAQIETMIATTKLDFEPTFDIHDTFEDIYEDFSSKVALDTIK